MSQEVFSRYLNVPVIFVSQWERRPGRPSSSWLIKYKGLDTIA